MTALDLSAAERLRRIETLPEKQKAEVLARVKLKQSADREVWFCKRGRVCDGKPHPGAPNKHARGDQWPPPGQWDTWFYMSGRGAGKTKAGGHWTRQMARYTDRIALIGRRGVDVRATMVEGPAGLIKACEQAGETYDWKPALKEFTFENGAKAFGYSGEEPESLRGPEHGAGWLDEPCHIALIDDVWSNYTLGLRSEGVPGGARTLLTSSPLPTKWTRERIDEKGQELETIDEETGELDRAPRTVLVQVPTKVNLHNLDEGYKRRVINPLKGTRKGKQELDALLLEEVEGALWDGEWLQRMKFSREDCDYLVVSWDPAGTDKKTSDENGIIVAGKWGPKDEEQFGVFEDATAHLSPLAAAKECIRLAKKYQADAIVVERYGGDSATTILRQAGWKGKIDQVSARRGKHVRADPIAALYEQRRVWHKEGAELAELEDEQLTWVPGVTPGSPDHVDALVWALTRLSKRGVSTAKVGRARGRIRNTTPNRSPGQPRKAPWKN